MARRAALSLLAAMLSLGAAPGTGTTWRRCAADEPEIAIAACSAIISGGHGTGERLAAAYYNRGIAWRSKSQRDQALRTRENEDALAHAIGDYDAALRAKPDYAEALVNRGIAWFDKGRYDQAIADADRAIALRPDLAEAYNNRALAFYKQGRYDRAQADFDRTIRLRKNYGNALILRSLPPYGRTTDAAPDEP